MSKKKKASAIKTAADELLERGVTTRECYMAALPLLFELRDAIGGLKEFVKGLETSARDLSGAAATYAKEHCTALDEPLHVERTGVESGTVSVEGVKYRLTVSLGKFRRASGDNLTMDFLKALPEGWTREKRELNEGALSKLGASELLSQDLVRERKNEWSLAS